MISPVMVNIVTKLGTEKKVKVAMKKVVKSLKSSFRVSKKQSQTVAQSAGSTPIPCSWAHLSLERVL